VLAHTKCDALWSRSKCNSTGQPSEEEKGELRTRKIWVDEWEFEKLKSPVIKTEALSAVAFDASRERRRSAVVQLTQSVQENRPCPGGPAKDKRKESLASPKVMGDWDTRILGEGQVGWHFYGGEVGKGWGVR